MLELGACYCPASLQSAEGCPITMHKPTTLLSCTGYSLELPTPTWDPTFKLLCSDPSGHRSLQILSSWVPPAALYPRECAVFPAMQLGWHEGVLTVDDCCG